MIENLLLYYKDNYNSKIRFENQTQRERESDCRN